MISLFTKVMNIGLHSEDKSREAQQVRLTNLCAFLATLFSGVIMVIIGAGFEIWRNTIPCLLVIASTLFLSNLKYHSLARFSLVIGSNILIFVSACILGRDSGIQYCYFAVLISPFLFGEGDNWLNKGFFFTLPISLFAILELTDYSLLPRLNFDPEVTQRAYVSTMILVALVTSLIMGLMTNWHIRSERELRNSEEQYRLITENSHDIISRHLLDGSYIFISPSVKQLGYEPEEFMGRTPYEFIHEDDFYKLKDAIAKLLENKTTQAFSHRIRRKDGTHSWFESTIKMIRTRKRDLPLELQVSTRDISVRKMAENRLKEREGFLFQIFEASPIAIAIARLDGSFVEVNRSLCQFLGYPREELLNMSLASISDPEDYARNLELDTKILNNESGKVVMQKTCLRKDGSKIHATLQLGLLKSDDGKPELLVGHFVSPAH